MMIPGSYQRPFQAVANPMRKPISLIAEINERLAEETDVSLTQCFYVNARVLEFKTDPDQMYYLACPNSECKRKVKPDTDQSHQDMFWCEHCSRHYRTCDPTYIFQAKVADFTDAIVVMFARDNGTPLLGGLTAD